MKRQYAFNGYILDPHGAVGALGLAQYRKSSGDGGSIGVVLETAHPAKFIDTVEETLQLKLELPAALSEAAGKEKQSIKMAHSVERLKEFLLS